MIDLPSTPAPASATAAEIDFGMLLRPPLGGPLQRVNRLGNRHKIAVVLPPMKYPKTGRQWLIALKRGKKEGARLAYPLQGFDPGSPGAPVVDGSSAAGMTLPLRGCTPRYAFRNGQPFSLVTGGRHHIHFVDGEVVADGSGNAVLAIDPPLRAPPLDADACHFGKPMIEGFIDGDELAWEFALASFVALSFTIEEAE
jgi:hypothetical protein